MNTGLICSCTPALKPFLDYFASGGSGSHSRKLSGSPDGRRSEDPIVHRKHESRRIFGLFDVDVDELEIKAPCTRQGEVVQDV